MNKIVLIVLPLLVVGGGSVVGLAMAGKIDVPGLTPKKKPVAKAPAKEEKKPVKKAAPVAEAPKEDPAKGQQALAKLWDEVDIAKLKEITATWKPSDLAPVLMRMDQGKVSEYLGELEAARASALSLEIQRLASQPVG